MCVYALWNGGSSYAAATEDDLEEFPSLRAARWAFEARYDNLDRRTPCVDEGASMWLFFKERPADTSYPDRVMEFGPRGGIRITRA